MRSGEEVLAAVERVGGAPVIVKLVEGTQGVGVILAETSKVAQAIVETLSTVGKNVLIQRFVEESRGTDVRAFCVGGRVVAAMRRTASGDEYRSNVHRGAHAEGIALSADYERIALRAAEIMGLAVAGVDMLEGKDGPLVMEVNSSPGLEGIEGATRVDVASAIVQHLEAGMEERDAEVKERLALDRGYSVADVHVGTKHPSIGKTIGGSGLLERDVRVLLVRRGSLIFPSPEATAQIMSGDVLTCFGRIDTLRSLGARTRR